MTSIQVWSIIILLIQGLGVYWSWRMVKFTGLYSKSWRNAFIVFLLAMSLATIRRGIVVAWSFGLDGHIGIFLRFTNDYIMNFVFSTLWVVFLGMLYRWWGFFFKTYLTDSKWIEIFRGLKRK